MDSLGRVLFFIYIYVIYMVLCRGDLVSVYLVYNNNVLYLLYVDGRCFSYLMVELFRVY